MRLNAKTSVTDTDLISSKATIGVLYFPLLGHPMCPGTNELG